MACGVIVVMQRRRQFASDYPLRKHLLAGMILNPRLRRAWPLSP